MSERLNTGWRLAWLGLGGNLGDVRENMRSAIEQLASDPGVRIEAVSSLYATPPWGIADQPEFRNACVTVATTLSPHDLLKLCLDTETGLNRQRGERWGPRTIDIDILAIEGVVLSEDGLSLPHPRLHERAFVLVPLAEIAPDLEIAGKPVRQWLETVDRTEIRQLSAGDGWSRPDARDLSVD